ncbi:TetR/AcrR family transcriptional regulator [Sphingomonas sp. TREG-RG-20F-R18-01]|uniref:TetR/AcrR family transcriptional regulator n=1 Tax=Sphingomonas sp. TREG-RG-20F-R18-01 TaxID=2914982 RepID=UPI001F59586A|nr:TetR/AcrR family transcriptional regulator [Sphingomonas sp. TREG-RG-20F-R18-01]
MVETTKEQLVSAASKLLDSGGQSAVTLRAVAEQVDVSHNAPYRHFRDRSALLAAVAERDFVYLREAFEAQNNRVGQAETVLRNSVAVLIDYAREHKARYRLLFSDPGLLPGPSLTRAALASFQAFSLIVARCQQDRVLPQGETAGLTGLIYATLHGAIDLELGGRASETKGLGSIEGTIGLLIDVLTTRSRSKA